MAVPSTVQATVNYFPEGGPTRIYPGTAGYQRRQYDTKTLTVTNVRGSEEDYTLDKNGFQVVQHGLSQIDVKAKDEDVKSVVYPETIDLMKKITGAAKAVPFSHQIRTQISHEVKKMAEGAEDSKILPSAGPAHFVHCDHDRNSVLPVLEKNLPADEVKIWERGQWAIMNLWRPPERPVTMEPLALLDSSSVDEDDFVRTSVIFPKPGEGAFDGIYQASEGFHGAQIRANEQHRWYFVSSLGIDEALVFKQYDSRTDGRARQTPHTAIETEFDHRPARQSIEVRCLLYFGE